ncbi:YceI family protein [Bdellovibrio sp. HCB337]|uniref:YceI family protein n=1 Tax=Bdellovibrio sp. HCB337 TaxID=3394358 RepID=UPI0039A596FD
MKFAIRLLRVSIVALLFSPQTWAATAVVDVTLRPAGSFKAKVNGFKGFAVKNGDTVEAQNIVVNLEGIETGIELRDTHTKQFLQTDKHPEAVLVSAKGKDGKGVGKIRIRGIEKEVSGTYRIDGEELVAVFNLNLPDFKIQDVSYMGVSVNEAITLHVTVPLKPASAVENLPAPTPTPAKIPKPPKENKKPKTANKKKSGNNDRCFITLPGGEFLELKHERNSGQTNVVFVYSQRGETSDKIAANLGKSVYTTDVKLLTVNDTNFKSVLNSEDFKEVIAHLFKDTPYGKGGSFDKWINTDILTAEFRKCHIK